MLRPGKCLLSRVKLEGHEVITGMDAVRQLSDMGIRCVYVDDEGRIRSLNKATRSIDGYYVYKKE